MLVELIQKYIGIPTDVSVAFIVVILICLTVIALFGLTNYLEYRWPLRMSPESRPVPKSSLRGVPPKEVFEQDLGCPEQGSKDCELRGCLIIGSCQRPT